MPTTWTADITDIVKPHYERGLEQGAYQKAIETAKRLKKLNVETKVICESTGLSKEEVAKL